MERRVLVSVRRDDESTEKSEEAAELLKSRLGGEEEKNIDAAGVEAEQADRRPNEKCKRKKQRC